MIGTKCYSSSDKALNILEKVEDVVNVGIECDCYDVAREYYKAECACWNDPYDEDAIENFYKRQDDLDRAEEGDEDSRNILEQIKEFKENIHKSQKEYEKRPVELTSEDAKNLQNTMRSNQRPVFTPKRRGR